MNRKQRSTQNYYTNLICKPTRKFDGFKEIDEFEILLNYFRKNIQTVISEK